MSNVYPGTRYRTVGTALTSTSATAVYTAGAGTYAELTSITITPAGGVGGNVTVSWFDDSESDEFTLIYEIVLPTIGSVAYEFGPLHCDPGDQLRVAGENGMHVTVSLMEAGRNAGVR